MNWSNENSTTLVEVTRVWSSKTQGAHGTTDSIMYWSRAAQHRACDVLGSARQWSMRSSMFGSSIKSYPHAANRSALAPTIVPFVYSSPTELRLSEFPAKKVDAFR